MKYKAVIFDLDGTILDTIEDLASALNFSLRNNGFSEKSTDETRRMVGNGIRKLILRALPSDVSQELFEKIHKDFMTYYNEHCTDMTRRYDGVFEAVAQLKKDGYVVAVLSNKADFAVNKLCEYYYPGVFAVCSGEIAGVARKPSTEPVDLITSKLNLKPEECIYVGDSDIDVKTAKNSGMKCVSVDWGFRSRIDLIESGAEVIVDSPNEMISKICNINCSEL